MTYHPAEARYNRLPYRATGRHGLKLPAIALGLWHNFGAGSDLENCRAMLRRAFDLGITHFDLANNYGPPPGSAEETFGRLLREDLAPWRDELVIASKAGYEMWPGPYGDGGSRKYLFNSLHQSLRRLGVDYLDIFYHHRPDPATPLAETMQALADMVRQGKVLYVGLSNYPAPLLQQAARLLEQRGTPCLIHQVKYSLLERGIEADVLPTGARHGLGGIAFSPLAGGQLSDRYLHGIPADSRAASASPFLNPSVLTPERLSLLQALHAIAQTRGQKLSQLALQWVLRDPAMTTALIGASRVSQIDDAVAALQAPPLEAGTLAQIDALLAGH